MTNKSEPLTPLFLNPTIRAQCGGELTRLSSRNVHGYIIERYMLPRATVEIIGWSELMGMTVPVYAAGVPNRSNFPDLIDIAYLPIAKSDSPELPKRPPTATLCPGCGSYVWYNFKKDYKRVVCPRISCDYAGRANS